ncbi:MAG: nickel-dependent lactate racemase [Candidatus Bathyarchaeia archaeon]
MLKNIEIKYGNTEQTIHVPLRNLVCVAERRYAPIVTDEETKIAEAIKLSSIEEVISPSKKVAIIIDDATRPTPTHKILPPLLKKLEEMGVKKDTVLVMATGAHEKPNQESIRRKISEEVMNDLNIQVHDCLNKDELTLMGFSSFGTPIWINKYVAEADVKIGLGGIKPHPWAGFSGGAKIILPGVSSWEAIGRNHTLAISEEARLGNVEHNPIRKDMEEVASKVGLNIIINTVLNDEGRIIDVVAGNFIKAHREGVYTSRKLFEYNIEDEVDVLIIGFGPEDETLWDVLTGKFVGVKQIIKDGGTLILVASCPNGMYQYGRGHLDYSGKLADYSKVIELLKSGASPEEMISETLRGGMPYLEVGVKAYILAKLARTKNVILASQNLKKEDVRWLGRVRNTAQEALDDALKTQGKDAKIAIIHKEELRNYVRQHMFCYL